jgi:Domain of unknown function/Glycosyl hydrolase-like 10
LLFCNSNHDPLLPPDGGDTVTTYPQIDTSIVRLLNNTPVILWMEASANFSRLGTAGRMADVFQKVADMGVKGIVIDVKGVAGLVCYNSSIAEQLKTWNGYTQEANFDYLRNAITEAKKKGLKVFASMCIFTEGMNYGGIRYGKVYNDPDFADMQSQVMTVSGEVRKITDLYSYGMINPLQPAAQDYELSLINEVVSNYDLDGFVLDYCRYYDICADFSDYSLTKFKEWANLASVKPTDIVQSWKTNYGAVVPDVTGPQYKKWLEFRAMSLRDFIEEARTEVKSIKPKMAFCSYSGAWYDSYYYVGVNWASNTYDPYSGGFSSWATPTYKNTGIAELLDLFMTGNYTATLSGTGWWSVQGQIEGAKTILKNANIQYGAVDIGNTVWADMKNMQDAIVMILKQTKGIMLFDLVHIDDPATNHFDQQLYVSVKQAIDQGLDGK